MIVAVLVAILLGLYVALGVVPPLVGRRPPNPVTRGRISLALVLVVTGLGHFVQAQAMAAMLPAWVPGRMPLIYATGLAEWAAAVGLLLSRTARVTALCLIVFFVVVFPANVYAAVHRVPMGGHEAGPAYLLLRGPFQALLIWWAWRFGFSRD